MRQGARNVNSSFARFNGRRIPSSRVIELDASSTQAATAQRVMAKAVNASETVSPVIPRSLAKAAAAAQAEAPTRGTAVNRTISRSTTGSPTLIAGRGYVRLMSVTGSETAAITTIKSRAVTKSVTQAESPTIARTLAKAISIALAGAPARTQSLAFIRTISASQSVIESEASTHKLVVTEAQTATLLQQKTLLRTLTAGVAQAVVMNRLRGYGRLMTVSESMLALIERLATGHPAPAVIQIYDIGPTYSRATLIGATTVVPPDQKMLDILAMLTVNTPIYVCDNALKLALDQAPELSRVI